MRNWARTEERTGGKQATGKVIFETMGKFKYRYYKILGRKSGVSFEWNNLQYVLI